MGVITHGFGRPYRTLLVRKTLAALPYIPTSLPTTILGILFCSACYLKRLYTKRGYVWNILSTLGWFVAFLSNQHSHLINQTGVSLNEPVPHNTEEAPTDLLTTLLSTYHDMQLIMLVGNLLSTGRHMDGDCDAK